MGADFTAASCFHAARLTCSSGNVPPCCCRSCHSVPLLHSCKTHTITQEQGQRHEQNKGAGGCEL